MKTLLSILTMCSLSVLADEPAYRKVATALLADARVEAEEVPALRAALQDSNRSALIQDLGADKVAYLDDFVGCLDEETQRAAGMLQFAKRRYEESYGATFELTAKEQKWFGELLPYYTARRRMLWRDLLTPAQQVAAGRAVVEARIQQIRRPMEGHFNSLFSPGEIDAMSQKGLCLSRAQAALLPAYPARVMQAPPHSSSTLTVVPGR